MGKPLQALAVLFAVFHQFGVGISISISPGDQNTRTAGIIRAPPNCSDIKLAAQCLSGMHIATRNRRGIFFVRTSPRAGTYYRNYIDRGGGIMVKHSADQVFRQVNRIFQLGAVGSVSDAQLLDWFISRKDECAEAD